IPPLTCNVAMFFQNLINSCPADLKINKVQQSRSCHRHSAKQNLEISHCSQQVSFVTLDRAAAITAHLKSPFIQIKCFTLSAIQSPAYLKDICRFIKIWIFYGIFLNDFSDVHRISTQSFVFKLSEVFSHMIAQNRLLQDILIFGCEP